MSADASGNPPKSLLVVRLGAMGDVIHTMHAVAGLRKALPETQIGWVVEERWAELLCARGTSRSGARCAGRSLVDFVHLVNTKAWRKSPLASGTRQQFSAALKEIRGQQYDLAIDFQGAIKSGLLARLCGAGTVVGMDQPRESPAKLFYTKQVKTKGAHVIEQYCSLAEDLLWQQACRPPGEGARPHTIIQNSLEFPFDQPAEQAVSCKVNNTSAPIILINPGAGWGAKQWPPEGYGEISRELAKQGAHVLVNYGPDEEELGNAVHDSSGGAAQTITCSVAELIALTRRASLFIGGDTGPLHLAAALGIPIVAIFGPTDPARNGPYTGRGIVLRNPASHTSLSHTSQPDPGLLQIMPGEVLAAARKLLEGHNA